MRNLILLILRFKNLLSYLFLSLLSFIFIVNFNHIQRSNWLNSTNRISGNVNETTANIGSYFRLKQINKELTTQNANLLQKLTKLNSDKHLDTVIFERDSLKIKSLVTDYHPDSNDFYIGRYTGAEVIKNTTNSNTNFITINKGSKDSIKIDDGAVTKNGIVGRVVSTSEHFALIKSVLHTNNNISVKLKKQRELGTLYWTGDNSNEAHVKDIPRHVELNLGDSVITSGYGTVYPSEHLVGTIKEVTLEDHDAFYDIIITLSTNFNSLDQVYIYHNEYSPELRALLKQTDTIP